MGLSRAGFIPVRDPLRLKRGGRGNRAIGLLSDDHNVTKALGPGTLWISADETKRLRALLDEEEKRRKLAMKLGAHEGPPVAPVAIAFLPIQQLFGETPPSASDLPLWKSEAALFVRWGLVGPEARIRR